MELTKRIGCKVGDSECWLSKGGYCTDYIEKMTGDRQQGNADKVNRKIKPRDVRKGDVAIFLSRLHFAYVESVVKDKKGKTISVNISEYNNGSCWIDKPNMVTDKYKTVGHRRDIPVSDVDGGFARP